MDPRATVVEPLLAAHVVPAVAEALGFAIVHARDWELSRINALDFAKARGLPEDATLDGFLHASRLGLFEMSWNLLCPGCGGVLGANASLATITKSHYGCALCATHYELTLDELVEVSFMVAPRVRRIVAHDPATLSVSQYYRQWYFGPSLVMPTGDDWDDLLPRISLWFGEILPGQTRVVRVVAPPKYLIVFEPVAHSAVFVDVQGGATTDEQAHTIVFTMAGTSPTHLAGVSPGLLTLTLENRTEHRILPSVVIADDDFHHLLAKREFVTAKRLLTNQTFRDLFRAESFGLDQRLKLTSLTVVFTDLKGSTEMYERVGDLTAYDLVRSHFGVLGEIVRRNGGAVVKTIGDAVMAAFRTPDDGMRAALEMREGIAALNRTSSREDLVLKIGLHEGPCLAVVSNERPDYFGQTVNIAARVQGLADGAAILATEAVVRHASVGEMLAAREHGASARPVALKGIREEVVVYEIP